MPPTTEQRIREICEKVAGEMLDDGRLNGVNRLALRNRIDAELGTFVVRTEALRWECVADVVRSVEDRTRFMLAYQG